MYSDTLLTVVHILCQFCYLSKHTILLLCAVILKIIDKLSGVLERLAETNISYTFVLFLMKLCSSH